MDASQHLRRCRVEHALPVELWQEVFRSCCITDAILSAGVQAQLDNSRTARTPYRLSAVCMLWRAESLQTPELWTLIHVCVRPQTSERVVLAMIQTNLHRSVDRSLQLLVYIATEERHNKQLLHDATVWLSDVYDHLGEVAHRWRRCYVQLSTSLINRLQLRIHTPVLEELCLIPFHGRRAGPLLVDYDPEHLDQYSDYLAQAPQLHRLESHSWCFTPRAPLNKLEYLSYSLRHYSLDDPLWLALAMTPALCELHIYFPAHDDREGDDSSPEVEIYLPALETLGVYGLPRQDLSFELVKMPRLRTLLVSIEVCDLLGNLFGAVSREVRHVVITSVEETQTGFLSADDSEALSLLVSVETLELRGLNRALRYQHQTFFSGLTISLPSMTRLILDHCRFALNDCGPIAKLVQQNPESGCTQYTLSFRDTVLLCDWKNLPEWYAPAANLFAGATLVDVQKWSPDDQA